MRSPFSLFKKSTKKGLLWYSRFWDEAAGAYTTSRSTGVPVVGKKGRWREAYEAARAMLPEIQAQQKTPSPLFLDYLAEFWQDDSPYVKAKRLGDRKPLSGEYVRNARGGIAKHVLPFPGFARKRLDEIRAGAVEDWRLWALEGGIGHVRLNSVFASMRVAVRVAVERGDLAADPFAKVKALRVQYGEKGILTPQELRALLSVEERDIRVRGGVALAALCGMRRGEARGLRWEDVDRAGGVIHIRHNYVRLDGDKGPKWGSARDAILPAPVAAILDEVEEQYGRRRPSDYVIGDPSTGEPAGEAILRRGFARMLKAIGIDAVAQKTRRISLHSLRHGFITLARAAGLSDLDVQTLAGHRSAEMMNHYSHGAQIIDLAAAREGIERAIAATS